MATTHHRPGISGTLLPRSVPVIIGTSAAAILWLIGIGNAFGGDDAGFALKQTITPTHARPAPSPPPQRAAPPVRADYSAEDNRFIALVAERAYRQNYPVGNHGKLFEAARVVCARVGSGSSLIDASSSLMVGYDFTGKQASGVGIAALEVYCPENRP